MTVISRDHTVVDRHRVLAALLVVWVVLMLITKRGGLNDGNWQARTNAITAQNALGSGGTNRGDEPWDGVDRTGLPPTDTW
jgi:hypothetical protein